MPLTFTGEHGSTAEFELLLEAFDGERRVVVVTSQEAMEDHGLERIQERASAKYDAGHTDESGRVHVLTSDC